MAISIPSSSVTRLPIQSSDHVSLFQKERETGSLIRRYWLLTGCCWQKVTIDSFSWDCPYWRNILPLLVPRGGILVSSSFLGPATPGTSTKLPWPGDTGIISQPWSMTLVNGFMIRMASNNCGPVLLSRTIPGFFWISYYCIFSYVVQGGDWVYGSASFHARNATGSF